MSVSGTEVVVPYASRNGRLHLRIDGDYRTFCGRLCDGWSLVEDQNLSHVLDNPELCSKCKANI